ncbi:MAG: peptidoglycan DD-metalloendopeptidase family protein [Bauldia sp.]
MGERIRWFRSRFLGHAALVALLAGSAAGCADATRVGSPYTTGATSGARLGSSSGQPMPPALVGGAAPAAAEDVSYGTGAPTVGVTRADLPPAGGTAYAAAGSGSASFSPAPTRVAASQTVVLGPNETLFTLSQRYNVPVDEIIEANRFVDATRIPAGTKVVIPGHSAGAPATRVAAAGPSSLGTIPGKSDGTPLHPAVPSAAKEHVVRPGESLEGIARQYGIKLTQLMAANNIDAAHPMKVGQRLRIPAPGAPVVAAATTPTATPAAVVTASASPSTPVVQPAVARPSADPVPTGAVRSGAPADGGKGGDRAVATAAAIPEPVDSPSSDGQQFRWPVKGRIISNFGTKPNGERNDGINLSVPDGTSIKAAEAGTVIYSGNEIAGYGNLILIRHAGGWVTAYAHNSDLLVKRGDTVKRGQTISKAGATGSVTAPQLHFELRRGSNPVNPLEYLGQTG